MNIIYHISICTNYEYTVKVIIKNDVPNKLKINETFIFDTESYAIIHTGSRQSIDFHNRRRIIVFFMSEV